jgi:hypothetical protein
MRNILLVLPICAGLVSGQVPRISPEQRQALLDYPLTLARANQLITAVEAMTKYVVSLPDFQDRMRKAMTMAPAERLAQVENDAKAMAIIKQNGLTAKEYLVGVPALNMAMMAAQSGAKLPETVVASPANVAFVKANMAALKPKWDAANGLRAPK